MQHIERKKGAKWLEVDVQTGGKAQIKVGDNWTIGLLGVMRTARGKVEAWRRGEEREGGRRRQAEMKCRVAPFHSLQSRTMRQFTNPSPEDERFPVDAAVHLSGNFLRVCHFHPCVGSSEMSDAEDRGKATRKMDQKCF